MSSLSMADSVHKMDHEFGLVMSLMTNPFPNRSGSDGPVGAHDSAIVPTNANAQTVALTQTAKELDNHVNAFMSTGEELQLSLARIHEEFARSHAPSQEDLCEEERLEREVLCMLAEAQRAEALTSKHLDGLQRIHALANTTDRNNLPLTEELLSIPTPSNKQN